MTMKLISREMTWYLPDNGPVVEIVAHGDQVRATIGRDVPWPPVVIDGVRQLGVTKTQHRTFAEALAHAEKDIGQPLPIEGALGREAWSDDTMSHVVYRQLLQNGTGSFVPTWGCSVSTLTSITASHVTIKKDRLATREQAIEVGQALIPIVRAALKATKDVMPDRY